MTHDVEFWVRWWPGRGPLRSLFGWERSFFTHRRWVAVLVNKLPSRWFCSMAWVAGVCYELDELV